jgi:hypothetical protein
MAVDSDMRTGEAPVISRCWLPQFKKLKVRLHVHDHRDAVASALQSTVSHGRHCVRKAPRRNPDRKILDAMQAASQKLAAGRDGSSKRY